MAEGVNPRGSMRAKARCPNVAPGSPKAEPGERAMRSDLRPRRRPLQSAPRRGTIRSGTSAWRKRHAFVHIDLHSRRLRNVESPSVLEFVFSILTPRVLRGHRAQPWTRIRSRRWCRRPPALPRAFQSYAIHFHDRRAVEAIVFDLDQ